MSALPPRTTPLEISLPDWLPGFLAARPPCVVPADRMRLAIALASENVAHCSGGPFGAAIFSRRTGDLISVGVNRVVPLANSTLHSEMTAIMFAQKLLGDFTLAHGPDAPYELYSSCAPCAMCLGAILWSGLRHVTSGALREDALRVGFDEGPVFPESFHYLRQRGIDFVEGSLRDEALAVFAEYTRIQGPIYNG